MARRPKRSALVLTSVCNTFRLLTISFVLIKSILASDYGALSFGTNFNYPGQPAVQPKFGDRISPRHRQTLSVLANNNNINNNNGSYHTLSGSPSTSAVAGSSSVHISNNHNHKSLLDSLNSSVTSNSSQINHSGIDHVHKSFSSSSVTNVDDSHRYLSSYSASASSSVNASSLPDKSDPDNDSNRNDHHLLNDNNIPSNVVLPVAGDDDQRLSDREHYRDGDQDRLVQHQPLRRNDDTYDGNYNHVDNGIGSSDTNSSLLKADRLIEMSTEFFVVPSSTTEDKKVVLIRSSTVRPKLILAAKTPPTENESTVSPASTGNSRSGLRKEPWVVPLLVVACLAMILMAAFEIFVLFKAWRTSPSRRHLFLGQMLLLGLFACAGIGALLTANPTIVSCGIIRFGAGVAFALVFAALLVKCVFLISLNGGVYLPAPYQGLLLLFAVLIQVAIGTQWLMTEPPDIQTITIGAHHATVTNKFSTLGLLITSSDLTRIPAIIPLCKTQFSELLLSMIYIVFLILFVAILAIKSRGIRDNYREATYIGLAIGGSIPIWLGWTLCGLIVADRHKDACLAFGLVATSATVFLVMFMPKGRQLAAMGKEGLYVEDRDEQFSSLSRAGSGYSPSFFHFKPIKYGVMGGVLNSTSNTGNVSKHQSAATLGGDRVALVTAAPPSYTRMYHYFPAHMAQPFCFYPPPPPPISPPPPPLKALAATIGGGLSTLQNHHHHQQHHHQQQSTLKHQQQQQQQSAQLAQTLRYPDEANLYTTLEPTLSSNPNVYFQRSGGVHPGMMY